jgi:quinol monooxygenase YgiN
LPSEILLGYSSDANQPSKTFVGLKGKTLQLAVSKTAIERIVTIWCATWFLNLVCNSRYNRKKPWSPFLFQQLTYEFSVFACLTYVAVCPIFTHHQMGSEMVSLALLVRLEAKPGKEGDVEAFLRGGLALVREEPATIAWFAVRLGTSTFGIFDAFPDDAARQAHLAGRVAAALMARAPELLSEPPVIEKIDILAAKLPG